MISIHDILSLVWPFSTTTTETPEVVPYPLRSKARQLLAPASYSRQFVTPESKARQFIAPASVSRQLT